MRKPLLLAVAMWLLAGSVVLRAGEVAGDSGQVVGVRRAARGPIRGAVVNASSGQAIPNAVIEGIYREQGAGIDPEFLTDNKGKFQGERQLRRLLLCARSQDGQLAGLLDIGPDDAEVTIKVHPLGEARGQIIDEATGQPAANRRVGVSIRVHMGDENSPWRTWLISSDATTDDRGHFALTKLVVGAEYNISVSTGQRSTQGVSTVKLASSGIVELGKLLLEKPYEPPTLDEQIARALGGIQQLKYPAALAQAQTFRQHVAILLVDPAADATRALLEWHFNDDDVRRAMDGYAAIVVDATGTYAQTLAKALNVSLVAGDALPQLVLRDARGKSVGMAQASDLSLDGKIDKAKVIEMLQKHALEPLDAQKLLDDALLEARNSNRRVLVQETAVWCGPCHLLTSYLQQQRPTWEKDYIWVRIDHRWANSSEVMNGLKAGYRGGIPWTAILDSEGQLLATSNASRGDNIGFPSTKDGIDHFVKMIQETSQRLTDEDLQKLRAGLEKKKS
jgi:hypothetical protein